MEEEASVNVLVTDQLKAEGIIEIKDYAATTRDMT